MSACPPPVRLAMTSFATTGKLLMFTDFRFVSSLTGVVITATSSDSVAPRTISAPRGERAANLGDGLGGADPLPSGPGWARASRLSVETRSGWGPGLSQRHLKSSASC